MNQHQVLYKSRIWLSTMQALMGQVTRLQSRYQTLAIAQHVARKLDNQKEVTKCQTEMRYIQRELSEMVVILKGWSSRAREALEPALMLEAGNEEMMDIRTRLTSAMTYCESWRTLMAQAELGEHNEGTIRAAEELYNRQLLILDDMVPNITMS